MAAINVARDTIPSPPESGEFAIVRIEASHGAADHAPRYVESVLLELRHILAGVRCPAHDCGPSVIVDFGSGDGGTLNVIADNCCEKLAREIARALQSAPIFRFVASR